MSVLLKVGYLAFRMDLKSADHSVADQVDWKAWWMDKQKIVNLEGVMAGNEAVGMVA